ncbi:MAG: hypothetical protein MUP16_01480 [Sedimentisphaerales bacterium]|nr:hypothetical protein [Sedimentisphaerales bacterium]
MKDTSHGAGRTGRVNYRTSRGKLSHPDEIVNNHGGIANGASHMASTEY